ncbi:MAG: glycogen/starch synthase [Woeseiaceae bacterium]|nr:glycogen/starch synthase [Woeseiaceae bacterium]
MAAENGSLPGGKVGGVGDVIRDLPPAIVAEGWRATIMTPSFGQFHQEPGAEPIGRYKVLFGGEEHDVEYFELDAEIRTILVHHPILAPTDPGRVYHDDGASRPFATDASKFAFFCAASAVWIAEQASPPDVVHLHDWHAAYYLVMKNFTALKSKLQDIRTVFTIHNLAYQGQRPFEGDASSLVAWFPGMDYEPAELADPHSPSAINPMAFAIRMADQVNTVSPTYAHEICMSSDHGRGFFGGEGLEAEISHAASEGRLHGILNGCDYDVQHERRPGWLEFLEASEQTLQGFLAKEPDDPVHHRALENLRALPKRRPMHVLSSIGRVVDQKMQLFFTTLNDGRSALEHILDRLGDKGAFFLLGSGDKGHEATLADIAGKHANFIYFRGYSEAFGSMLYRCGDLFLMPSSFEPCGISQMHAMRDGQPCVVHGVGGLRDTVDDSNTGFVFEGMNPPQQAANFVASVGRAMDMRRDHPSSWADLKTRAAACRFDWASSARQYIETLYEHNSSRH